MVTYVANLISGSGINKFNAPTLVSSLVTSSNINKFNISGLTFISNLIVGQTNRASTNPYPTRPLINQLWPRGK